MTDTDTADVASIDPAIAPERERIPRLRAPTHRTSAAGLIVLGTVAVAAGATIGFSYLTTTGLSIKAIGGLLAFACGAAAIVVGGTALLRATHGWRRWLAIPVALVACYVVVLPVTVAVYATNVPRPSLGSTTPADRGVRFEDATLRTSDGVELSGWYIPSTNGAAVALLHGASSTRSNVLSQAVVLAGHGYGVLLYDARGHGRSGGRAMEFGWYGDRDVIAAVTYLARRDDVDPDRVGVMGMSMGGEQAIGAMAADPRIAAAVAEGATNRVFADKAWLVDEYGARARLQRAVDWVTYGLTDLLTPASPPISLRQAVATAAPRPVLLITAGEVADEQHAGESVRAASPSSVELWMVPGADHTGGLATDPVQWEQRVIDFLDEHLTPPGAAVR